MNIDTLYISCFFISLIIIHIYNSDFKKFNLKIYEDINNSVKIKLYSIITIGLIHLSWLFASIFMDYNDNNYIYGLPLYILIPYILFVLSQYIDGKEESNTTIETNKYLNNIFSIYIIAMIIFIIIPDNFKIDIIKIIRKFIKKYIIQ